MILCLKTIAFINNISGTALLLQRKLKIIHSFLTAHEYKNFYSLLAAERAHDPLFSYQFKNDPTSIITFRSTRVSDSGIVQDFIHAPE